MPEEVSGRQAQYRLTLVCSFLHRFYLHCTTEVYGDAKEAMVVDKMLQMPPVPTIPMDKDQGSGTITGFVSTP